MDKAAGDKLISGRLVGGTIWREIAAGIAGEIQSGQRAGGERLPTEASLALRFGVNRHTIRRALAALAAQRLIRTEHGNGSFVAEDILDYRVDLRPRFSEWIRRHNREPAGDVLDLREMPVSALPEAASAAEALEIAGSAPVILLERLGRADERPVALSRHIFPSQRLPGLLDALKRERSITAALAQTGIADYLRKQTRASARLPDAREARLLKLAAHDVVLACENTNIRLEGEPTEFCSVIYPARRVQLIFEP